MRLLRLALENWRGIERLEVRFSGSVTLIEGPNEIGKSTIVEALRMLFEVMDSSGKRAVKAIQPVGEDVGSIVEAEVQSGPYHFVYRKTYNRGKNTSLKLLAPAARQFTGREAHEHAARMLSETVDLALWKALLVDQGEKVALANLQESSGLARALDQAAGAGSATKDDAGLYGAVQAEYEQYFTLKTGRERFTHAIAERNRAQGVLQDAQDLLEKVEQDTEEHQRCVQDIERRKEEVRRLQASVEEHEKSWSSIRTLREELATKERALESARIALRNALDAGQRRKELEDEIRRSEEALRAARESQAPLHENAAQLKQHLRSAKLVSGDRQRRVQATRDALELARRDRQYCQDREALETEKRRYAQLVEISMRLKSSLQIVSATKVDDATIDALRSGDNRLSVARGKRDAAATTVSVTAEQALELAIDGTRMPLEQDGRHTQTVASDLDLRIPGVVTVRVSPSQSAAELQQAVDAARGDLEQLHRQFGVTGFEEAMVANQRRSDAQRDVDHLKTREEEILKGALKEEVEEGVASLQKECDGYLARRQSEREQPLDRAAAARAVTEQEAELADKVRSLDAARARAEAMQAEFEATDQALRAAEQDLAGRKAALADRQERLQKERAAESDALLHERVTRASVVTEGLEREAQALATRLAEVAPDAVEARLVNAKDALQRAQADLKALETRLAVLADRLERAQADGRFEARDRAEQAFERAEAALCGIRRRAGAARLLWTTLNMHRNAARQAYVKPLKDAIERLGAIVFGGEFEVEVGEDWSLNSRTLHGKTLPFDDLSVGAKEQLGILARLAAAQIVSHEGGVPLIIDDALGFSDPARLETMGAAIAAAGKDCQIIILTCTPGRFTHVGNAVLIRLGQQSG
jgi:chromosome segregation ATPase